MIFTYNNEIYLPLIKLGNHKNKEANNTKLLGVYIDKNRTFDYHIKYIWGKISK